VAVTLLKVGDHLSLEMAPENHPRVRAFIRSRWPEVRSRNAGLGDIVTFGGADLIYDWDADDPCLISGTDAGDSLLTEIHAALGEPDSLECQVRT
jgi:hypothetical protein